MALLETEHVVAVGATAVLAALAIWIALKLSARCTESIRRLNLPPWATSSARRAQRTNPELTPRAGRRGAAELGLCEVLIERRLASADRRPLEPQAAGRRGSTPSALSTTGAVRGAARALSVF